jgi:hypothetical protein
MILKAKERGGGAQLARYLLSMRDNDHVELHEVRGFVGDDLLSAFREVDAIAKGTRCENYLFSASLNPPGGETVTTADFEQAADEVERKLGLDGQPRAIVFHEKDGRRHAHVVWSRIDADRMRAINLPHYKMRLRDVSRELFCAHGWEMPKGLRDWQERDPLGYTREEWQQARRIGLDPKHIKALFQESWNRSDSGMAFAQALKERGFMLARGDRRSFVAVDYRGEVYAVARQACGSDLVPVRFLALVDDVPGQKVRRVVLRGVRFFLCACHDGSPLVWGWLVTPFRKTGRRRHSVISNTVRLCRSGAGRKLMAGRVRSGSQAFPENERAAIQRAFIAQASHGLRPERSRRSFFPLATVLRCFREFSAGRKDCSCGQGDKSAPPRCARRCPHRPLPASS